MPDREIVILQLGGREALYIDGIRVAVADDHAREITATQVLEALGLEYGYQTLDPDWDSDEEGPDEFPGALTPRSAE